LSKFIFRHLPKHIKKTHAKTFSKKFEEEKQKDIIFILLEMIGATREVDKDWAEFESYATNLYARSVLINQSASTSVPSKLGSEKQLSSDVINNNSQFQSNTNYSDIKTITDEMVSVRKAVVDLRTYSEEVTVHINSETIIIVLFFF